MQHKFLEVRDKGTFMKMLAIKFTDLSEIESFIVAAAGYGRTSDDHASYVILLNLSGPSLQANYDPYEWNNTRTVRVAHQHVIDHWDEITSGDVIDVEFILGERSDKKQSERLNGMFGSIRG